MANRCEDFPCCGHELGDCDGSLYGDPRNDPHLLCDHETGYCEVEEAEQDWEDWDEDEGLCGATITFGPQHDPYGARCDLPIEHQGNSPHSGPHPVDDTPGARVQWVGNRILR